VIPALREASEDPALRGAPLSVYLVLLFELHTSEFRPLRQASVCDKVELSDRAVRDAMRTLEERGYIEAGESRPGEPRQWRLCLARQTQHTTGVANGHAG
jgi:hypothetical protein